MKYKYEQDKAKYMRKKCERNKLVKIAGISLFISVVFGVMIYFSHVHRYNMIVGLGFIFVIIVWLMFFNKLRR